MLDSQLSKAKNETLLDNPTRVLKVDDSTLKRSTQPSSSLTSRCHTNSYYELDDLIKRFATEPTISLQPNFSTTNVLLEPRKRGTNETGAIVGGTVGGGVGGGAAVAACCADAG